MNTNYNNDVAGALKLITVNGSVYQLGKDASASEGGIVKLFGGADAFESYKTSTVGTYDAKTVYDEIKSINDALGAAGEGTIAEQIAAAKSTVALAQGESYLTLSSAANAADGHVEYTISTTGIDNAISSAIASVVNGAPESFDTLKEIADWITADQTGAAAIIAQVANKADKVAPAAAGNFAGLDAEGNLIDSGSKASDFKTIQAAVASPSASGDAVAFIDSISQNANGVITATKKNVQAASATQAGLMSAADYNKLAAISANVSNDTLTIVTVAA